MSPGANDRLPPLNAVRAFEAAARCGSFVQAAADLGVTHWAVGKQIRLLEDWLGVALFERRARGVALTDEGADFLADVSAGLGRIAAGAGKLRQSENQKRVSGVVRVNALTSIALRWLIPKLPGFQERHPSIEVRVSTTSRRLRYIGSAHDIGIRTAVAPTAGLICEPLMPDRRLPACSPDTLSRHAIETIQDLQRHTLLHSATTRPAWEQWLASAEAPGLSAYRHLEFDHVFLQLQAAIDGLGVALASLPLIEADVAAGRLVCPLAQPEWRGEDYVVLIREDRSHLAPVVAFREWLVAAARVGEPLG
jgi:LysR family transcriptional regulator, glycine cleavage system transcriptional activator